MDVHNRLEVGCDHAAQQEHRRPGRGDREGVADKQALRSQGVLAVGAADAPRPPMFDQHRGMPEVVLRCAHFGQRRWDSQGLFTLLDPWVS